MKIIQILSHNNELYALDDEGNIYWWNRNKRIGAVTFEASWSHHKNPFTKSEGKSG